MSSYYTGSQEREWPGSEDESIAEEIADREVEEAAIEELFSRCPTCDSDAGFDQRGSYSIEPHGETHYDVWLVCRKCGAKTDEQELEALNKRCQP